MAIIGIDIDDVLSETVLSFLDYYNEKHDTNFKYDQITDYSFAKIFNITADYEMQSIFEFFRSDYYSRMAALPYAVDIVKELSKNNKLYAVSSRPTQFMDITVDWLDGFCDGCFEEVILTNSSQDGLASKSSVCKMKNIDYFIEDQIKFAEDCANVCKKVILLNKPWNKLELTAQNIVRCDDWYCVLSEIQ